MLGCYHRRGSYNTTTVHERHLSCAHFSLFSALPSSARATGTNTFLLFYDTTFETVKRGYMFTVTEQKLRLKFYPLSSLAVALSWRNLVYTAPRPSYTAYTNKRRTVVIQQLLLLV